MSLSEQQSLLDTERGGAVTIETDGRMIRPLLEIVNRLVDECKVRINQEGLSIRTVDPANVGFVEINAPASAFDSYEIDGGDELVVGLNLTELNSTLQDARMRKHDPDDVHLRLGTSVIAAEIEREYVKTTVTRTDEFLAIDPDSIREEPDYPNIDLPWKAEMDTRALSDTVAHMDRLHDYVRIKAASNGLRLQAVGEENGDGKIAEATSATIGAEMENVDDDEGSVEGIYSIDYVSDVVAGVKASKAETVLLELGDNIPLKLSFERKDGDGDVLYTGEYMVAPRIPSDD